MKPEKNFIAKKIKQALFDADLTQQELAKIIKTDQGLISAWQLGKRTPTIKSLEKIAKATNKPLDFFLAEENKISNTKTENNEIENLKKDLKLKSDLIDFLEKRIKVLEDKFETLERKIK